jgi:hypothetical protein
VEGKSGIAKRVKKVAEGNHRDRAQKAIPNNSQMIMLKILERRLYEFFYFFSMPIV